MSPEVHCPTPTPPLVSMLSTLVVSCHLCKLGVNNCNQTIEFKNSEEIEGGSLKVDLLVADERERKGST